MTDAADAASPPSPHSLPPPASRPSSTPPQVARPDNRLPRPDGELARLRAAWSPPTGWRVVASVNNVFIGKLYIATAFVFLLLGGVLALLMRAQLAAPSQTLIDAPLFQQLFTMHGTVMMFLFAVPMVEAIAVFLLPNMLGARDLPFPRLSAYSYWMYAIGGLAFYATLFWQLAPDSGWFMYPPLSGARYSPGLNADFWLLGIGFIEISAIAGAIELITGTLMTRAPGMSLGRMPVYAWAMLVVGLMIVLAFPAVIAGTALLELERAFDWPIFDATRGGDPLLWQHLFWFFGHPEVYIIFLPAAGLVSTMVPALARTSLIGRHAVTAALIAIGAVSFLLWLHHMFTAGLGGLGLSLVSIFSVAIAIPGALQIFAWIGTLWRGRLMWTTATWFLVGFLVTFVLGGLTGVMLALLPIDWQVHDTYFVVAHFHYVLIGGMVLPMFAALYHWMPLWKGRALSERVGRWVFGLIFGGFHLTFFPMHLAGMLGMPRRVHTYPAGLGLELPNLLSSIGAVVIAAGVLLFLVDLVRSQHGPEQAHNDPWRSSTLEWLPNEAYGTRSIPHVEHHEPLWHRPELHEEVEAGAHWLPGTVTGGRETLITSPIRAHPLRVIVLARDSLWPFLAAIGTAAFFLLMTVKQVGGTVAGGVLTLVSIWAWLWQTDRAPAAEEAEAADGVLLPLGASGRQSPSFWGVVILIVVEATIFASMAFAHLHVAMRLDVCPPPGVGLAEATALWLQTLAFALSWLLVAAAGRGAWRAPVPAWRSALLLPAFALAAWAFHAGLASAWPSDRPPTLDAWTGTLAALHALQGVQIVVAALLALYYGVRIASGLIRPRQHATRESVVLLWGWICVQGAITVWWPRLVA
ncbi:cytochrome ubiquinol oxidase subunit I [Roseateles chitinivorans]|uniref:Cytochrome ubiquinol oxidase subunit I n=1 Tax=Roseateles chitinivorans TaxID=2917965 RepID=A0A2G9C5S5_9BURK|nr:cbb3-type cytochrome c oxidase subunit I [Roseateles chitinivorans]PIM50994.1 cytochrome ubiquinol oxidase subunit I [Roseateles chitinivorans]